MRLIDELLDQVAPGGERATEAVRALGLLLEKRVMSRPGDDDGGLAELLGAELAAHDLTPQEFDQILDGLLRHTRQVEVPEPGVLWALGKSHDLRIVPALRSVLERSLLSEGQQDAAHQALMGLMLFDDQTARQAVEYAAREGLSEVREEAEDYLAVRGRR